MAAASGNAMSRAQTLVLALLALHLLLGTLAVIVGRGEHRSLALRWWGGGLLVYALGLLVTVAGSLRLVPGPLAAFAGNSFITLAPALCAAGVLAHTRGRLNGPATAIAVLATLGVLAAGNFLDWHPLLVNLIGPTPVAVALFVLAAAAIARRGPREARAACQFLAAMLALAVATWLARILAMLVMLDGTSDKERIDIVISLFAILQMINGVGATLALFWIDVRLMQAELSRVAHTDELTGLPNGRAIRARFQEELARASRHGHRFAMAVFDVDHFKQVNDRYGHPLGDEVLKAIGRTLADSKRVDDVLARIGGEEFVMLLPEQSVEGAREAAERLRHAVGSSEVSISTDRLAVTMSGGLALFPDDGKDWENLFAAADRRLYAAKKGGRNRVEAGD